MDRTSVVSQKWIVEVSMKWIDRQSAKKKMGRFSLVFKMSVYIYVLFPCDSPRGAKEEPGEQSRLPPWHQYPEKMYIITTGSFPPPPPSCVIKKKKNGVQHSFPKSLVKLARRSSSPSILGNIFFALKHHSSEKSVFHDGKEKLSRKSISIGPIKS